MFQGNKARQIFRKSEHFLPPPLPPPLPDTHVSGGKKCSFHGKFGVLCFLETPVLRFALFPFYQRFIVNFSLPSYLTCAVSDGIENLDEDAYEALNIEQMYVVTLSDGSEQELLPGGASITVEKRQRRDFSTKARKARMMESIDQVIIKQLLRDIPFNKRRNCSNSAQDM